MHDRVTERQPAKALPNTPVVLIVGPRRLGKTTLARKIKEAGCVLLTLDDQTALNAAQSDPAGLIRGLDHPPPFSIRTRCL